jgi:hypothetical protein
MKITTAAATWKPKTICRGSKFIGISPFVSNKRHETVTRSKGETQSLWTTEATCVGRKIVDDRQ